MNCVGGDFLQGERRERRERGERIMMKRRRGGGRGMRERSAICFNF
jgi:hypothetical protein